MPKGYFWNYIKWFKAYSARKTWLPCQCVKSNTFLLIIQVKNLLTFVKDGQWCSLHLIDPLTCIMCVGKCECSSFHKDFVYEKVMCFFLVVVGSDYGGSGSGRRLRLWSNTTSK